MEATGNQHDPVSKARFGVAKAIFNDSYALDPSQYMLNHHPNLADDAIVLPFLLRSLLARLLLDRLIDDHARRREGLKGAILMQFTVRGKGQGRAFREGFVMHRARRGRTQEADFAFSKVADDHIFIRVRFFLPL